MSACLKKETLLAFADGELRPDEMEWAERHIAVCTACKTELESIRATSTKVNAVLSSLVPEETASANAIAVIRIPYSGANARTRWAGVATISVLVAAVLLFAMIRRQHPTSTTNVVKTAAPTAAAPMPSAEKKEYLSAAVTKPAHVGTSKASLKVRQFQALDDGEPIETGMIYRVSLPASASLSSPARQSAKRIPAEVIVDEFGKVRAIRFLQ